MPRPIPATAAPKLIALMLEREYKDMTDFAKKNGINPGAFYTLCTDSNFTPLRTYKRIADALSVHAAGCRENECNCPGKISLEDIHAVFTADDIGLRKRWLISKMADKDIESGRGLARISGVSPATISRIISGKSDCESLNTYKAVSNGLGVDLDAFAHLFF